MRRHQSRIRGLLRHLTRDASVADDLAQDTFVRAWEKLESFRGDGRFEAWLSKLAYTRFLQHQRRRKLEARHRTHADPETVVTSAPNDEVVDLDRLLSVCSHDEQLLLVLNYAQGLSHTEIAAVVERPVGTVKSQIHRAKAKIRAQFALEEQRRA